MKRQFVLERLISLHGFERVVELGVWKGATLKHLVSKFPDIEYTGVDLYEPQPDGRCETYMPNENGHKWDHEANYKSVIDFIEKGRYKKARLLKMRTVEAAEQFKDRSVDLVFIDADHSYEGVCADIRAWLPKVHIGGFICGHDFSEQFPGVIQAVKEHFFSYRECDDTVWVASPTGAILDNR